MRLDASVYVLAGLAVVLGVVAYVKDPGLPRIGVMNGLSFLWLVVPRMIPALVVAGLMQVVVPPEMVSRYFGRQGGLRAIVAASAAGVATPGGPMVSMPLVIAAANSGAALPPLVAYMTAWSLFGLQRIISWEAPLLGWHFVGVRLLVSFTFPVLAGLLVRWFMPE